MESLRKQLADTQGALTERDKKFRKLRDDYKKLEAKIAGLEAENRTLKGIVNGTTTSPTQNNTGNSLKWNGTKEADGDDKVTISGSRMKQAETQFQQMANELAEKNKLCEKLQNKLVLSSLIPVTELSEEAVKTRWVQLRDQIRTLSSNYLNKPFSASLVSDNYKHEFGMLSPHWKTYTSTPNLTGYLFRALIWRYLIRYFEVPCRAWGRDTSMKIAEVAEPMSKKISEQNLQPEFQEWYIRTAALLHKVCPIDKRLIEEITKKIAEATTSQAEGIDPVAFRTSLSSIVTAAAELGAILDRSYFIVLMYDEPGSTHTHGFPCVPELMDTIMKLGSPGVVDLMVTPSLLKRDPKYSVIEKAEVIC
ncbi:hypothetical protein O1611_g9972 [Lasiodiplodia mahajangana]|uniref:Uncharacterized protein n=1 Tax=Lasiodiplodia mahajangana TaxID=1108764 RepID=A0ACC2J404_9PEZI|nr:hypothetical protein O1611_g9972 [Lasiodiplodia mahajangana]